MKPTVWTTQRKAMGNLVPAVFWLIPTGIGLGWMAIHAEIMGPGLWWVVGGTLVGWLSLNQFGGIENGRLRRRLEKLLKTAGAKGFADGTFVGFATPRYSSLLDAHEDIGFLVLLPDRIRFVSETRTVELFRPQVKSVRYRPNVHTWVGLGRWVSVEGMSEGHAVRLLLEPRDRITMLGNLRSGKRLKARIATWIAAKTAP